MARSGAGSPGDSTFARIVRFLSSTGATPAWLDAAPLGAARRDAFYHYGTLDGTPVPRALTAMESLVAFDRKTVLTNHARLAELYQRKDPDLLIVSAHDPTLLEQARATA
jgi:hypothetical protein